jgi:hypothetical protein
VVSILILSPILFAILVAVFGGPNKPTQNTSQAPTAAATVASAAVSSPPAAAPSIEEYRDAINRETNELGESHGRLSKLRHHPIDDSLRNAAAAEIALWQADYTLAQKRVPPPQLAEANAKYVHALALLVDSGKTFARALDDNSPHEFDVATGEQWEFYAEFKVAERFGLLSDADEYLPPAAPSTEEYTDVITRVTKEIGSSLNRFIKLGTRHPVDESWRAAVEDEIALWQADYELKQKVVPPPQYAEGHAKYVHALGLLADAAKKYTHGIDYHDSVEIRAGVDEIMPARNEIIDALRLQMREAK